ncbi:unnamed protein product [Enterobius vermicularis]|uniref:Uncharacterized protein n=1 Tax=Enterobius vermicularis TaxID=51028 RepID=A0A0N4VBJ8_ENTVE|nr:unnamed protein product [Enterobius vermicularis]
MRSYVETQNRQDNLEFKDADLINDLISENTEATKRCTNKRKKYHSEPNSSQPDTGKRLLFRELQERCSGAVVEESDVIVGKTNTKRGKPRKRGKARYKNFNPGQ